MVRKVLLITLCIAVVVAFALPAAALARGGAGKRSAAPGQVKKGARHSAAGATTSHGKGKQSTAAGKLKRHTSTLDVEEVEASENTSPWAKAQPKPFVSAETSPTPLLRITANIEKAIAKIQAGTRRFIPPGLVKVWLKFAQWFKGEPTPGFWDPAMEKGAATDGDGTETPTDGDAASTEASVQPPPSVETSLDALPLIQ